MCGPPFTPVVPLPPSGRCSPFIQEMRVSLGQRLLLPCVQLSPRPCSWQHPPHRLTRQHHTDLDVTVTEDSLGNYVCSCQVLKIETNVNRKLSLSRDQMLTLSFSLPGRRTISQRPHHLSSSNLSSVTRGPHCWGIQIAGRKSTHHRRLHPLLLFGFTLRCDYNVLCEPEGKIWPASSTRYFTVI